MCRRCTCTRRYVALISRGMACLKAGTREMLWRNRGTHPAAQEDGTGWVPREHGQPASRRWVKGRRERGGPWSQNQRCDAVRCGAVRFVQDSVPAGLSPHGSAAWRVHLGLISRHRRRWGKAKRGASSWPLTLNISPSAAHLVRARRVSRRTFLQGETYNERPESNPTIRPEGALAPRSFPRSVRRCFPLFVP